MGLLGKFSKAIFGEGKVDLKERFDILREATAGTMSRCYKARDKKNNRIVALKVLDPKKLEEFEARFKGLIKPSEGQIAVTLDHPRLVKTYEYGTAVSGETYLVMEYLEGPSLQSLIMRQSTELDGRRVRLLRQAAEGISALHAAGYIHRDICPRNMIASPDLTELKIIDFGLAVPASGAFLLPGNRTGTPNYMAPELVKRQRTDQRLDVFAFGVSAYEIFTYQLPWERGRTGQAAIQHANKAPVQIQELRPDIHPHIAEAIMRCVDQDVESRCPTMGHFLKQILDVPENQ